MLSHIYTRTRYDPKTCRERTPGFYILSFVYIISNGNLSARESALSRCLLAIFFFFMYSNDDKIDFGFVIISICFVDYTFWIDNIIFC